MPTVATDPAPDTSLSAKRVASAIAILAALLTPMALALRDARPAISSGLVINEVLLRNRFAHLDQNDNTFPWVELYNRGSVPLDLTGYSLTNDPKSPGRWKLPRTRLAPGEYLIVWCSGKRGGGRDSSASSANDVHADFELKEREILVLVTPDGGNADALVLPRQTEDRSYARTPDGSGPFRYHLNPTPASKNDGPSSVRPIPSIPDIHPVGGFYDSGVNIRIQIRLPLDDYEIRYTLDGSTPHPNSIRYGGSIVLLPGARDVGRTVRAAAFHQNQRISQIQTQSYFMEKPGLTLPALSISMAPPDFESLQLDLWARGPSSEKEVFLEAFGPEGGRAMGVDVGMRLHGFTGREGNFATKKSYRLHFRDRYGDGSLEYPLIPHTAGRFQRLVLRANNDDAFRRRRGATYVRDQLIRELHEEMGAIASHGSWYNLYVNMRFKGVYNVVERIDGGFLRTHARDGSTEWDVLQDGIVEGDSEAWERLLAFLGAEDLRNESAYEEANRRLDVESFTDYMILNIWAQNHDWPHKNYVAVRPRVPEGKWIFLCWDGELSLGLFPTGYESDTFQRALTRPDGVGDIFAALFQNTRYQETFLARLEKHLEGVLNPRRVLERVRGLRATIGDDTTTEIRQFFSEEHVSLWNQNLDDLEEFVRQRPAVLRRHIYGSAQVRVPRLTEVIPADLSGRDSRTLSLRGLGFTRRMRVAINGIEIPITMTDLPEGVEVLLAPDRRFAGNPRITVSDPETGTSSRSDLLRVSTEGAGSN